MADWDQDVQRQLEREGIPPVVARQQSRLGVAGRNRARRGLEEGSSTPAASPQAAGGSVQPLQAQRPLVPARPQSLAPVRAGPADDDDDPFAAHERSAGGGGGSSGLASPSYGQQGYVHPLMAEPLRGHPPQQQHSQFPQSSPTSSHDPSSQLERDPSLRRIESTLRSTLDRPLGASSGKQLPPLTGTGRHHQAVPPLRLGDVINKVLGPRALTNPSAAPAHEAKLRGLVRQMKLHERVNPAVQPPQTLSALEAAEMNRLGAFVVDDNAPAPNYDENDAEDDEYAGEEQLPSSGDPSYRGSGGDAAGDEERRPLSPGKGKKDLPTSRLPIHPDDLARRPAELLEGGALGATAGGKREELMHFRVNQTAGGAGGALGNTGAGGGIMGGSVTNTVGADSKGRSSAASGLASSMGRGGSVGASSAHGSTGGGRGSASAASHDTFVESKTTGEFIRVRRAPAEDGLDAEDRRRAAEEAAKSNVHNIADFDHQIDTIIDSVNTIQALLASFWLMVSGILAGACLLQVYVVWARESDKDFLTYYSRLAGPARKVIYVLLGFSTTLALWRASLERRDPDRHEHFLTRYHGPNSSRWSVGRNILVAGALSLGFLLTLIMLPVEDYIETSYSINPGWMLAAELPQWYSDRITHWYGMAMVRLICVALAWAGIIARFGTAEYSYLQLQQEKTERRLVAQPGMYANPNTGAGAATSRTSIGDGTARSSTQRLSTSQRIPLQATGNGALGRTADLQQGVAMTSMRR